MPPNITLLPDNKMIIHGPTTAVYESIGRYGYLNNELRLVNDTSGACTVECMANCTQNCTGELTNAVGEIWCEPPPEPVEFCVPPPNCTSDCAHECLDPTYLITTDEECEEFRYRMNPDGTNMTVVSLPFHYNMSAPPECSRNVSLFGGNCSEELLFYNVTEHKRNLYVSEGCVRRCFTGCVERCFERYCITRLEEPVNETAICLPQCLERFFEEQEIDAEVVAQAAAATGGSGSGYDANHTACFQGSCYANATSCQLVCDAECLIVRSGNCSTACADYVDPNLWQNCLAGCLANASAICSRDCVYACTSNHTLAYGYPAPYDASGDYFTFEDLHDAADLHEADLASLAASGFPYIWSNRSRDCHHNCTLHCAQGCFNANADQCREDGNLMAVARSEQGLSAVASEGRCHRLQQLY